MSTSDTKSTPPAAAVPMALHGPWPAVSVFGRRWPGPGRPASPAAVIAVPAAGVVAALTVPLDRGGVGWLVTALAGTAAVVIARAVPHDPAPSVPHPRPIAVARDDPMRYGWATVTVLLLGAGTLRAAGWLVLLCLATACLTSVLAAAGGRSVRAMALASLMAIGACFRAVPWLSRGSTAPRRPGARGGDGVRIAATVVVSLVLLVVFGSLFASADAGFARLLHKAVPDINGVTVARWLFVFIVTTGIVGGATYLRAAPPDLSGLDGGARRRVARLEWAVPMGLLVLLFAAFVAVQLTVLFGGSAHVLDTDGLTYADYARSGFWQLLVVTGLTLLVLAGAARWAPRDTPADRALIRVVLGALAVLTLVIVASALHRMTIYADTYGLTRLRILVALCELWLGATFLLVILSGVRLRAGWLPRAVVAVGVLTLLGLVAANPDRLIAEQNITRYEQTGRIDLPYLAGLSADAVPTLMTLPQPLRDCAVLANYDRLIHRPDDWRGSSWGRATARDLLRGPRPEYHPACGYRD